MLDRFILNSQKEWNIMQPLQFMVLSSSFKLMKWWTDVLSGKLQIHLKLNVWCRYLGPWMQHRFKESDIKTIPWGTRMRRIQQHFRLQEAIRCTWMSYICSCKPTPLSNKLLLWFVMQSISYRETIDIVTCTQFLSNVESRAHVEVICVVAYYLVLMIIMDSVLKSAI